MKRAVGPLSALLLTAGPASAADEPGPTRIARWKDDKACAFILMFDDSMPSHVKHVVPELTERGPTGTFYVNQGTGHVLTTGQVARPLVRPAKAGAFNGRQSLRGKSQSPVAWMAGRRETNDLKPIDKAVLRDGERVAGPQRKRTHRWPRQTKIRRPSPQVVGEGSTARRRLAEAAARSGGVVAAAR